MAKKKKGVLELDIVIEDYSKEYMALYFVVPLWQADELAGGKSTRVLCAINGYEFPCALRPIQDLGYIITLSKEKAKLCKVKEGGRAVAYIVKDESEYGFPVPEEWEEYLKQDDELKMMFESLTPGKRRGWLYHIGSAKSIDTRIKRCVLIAEKVREEYYTKKS
jgi:hypothetical protein